MNHNGKPKGQNRANRLDRILDTVPGTSSEFRAWWAGMSDDEFEASWVPALASFVVEQTDLSVRDIVLIANQARERYRTTNGVNQPDLPA